MINSQYDKPKDKCGVVGVSSKSEVGYVLYYALQALQHRGQEYAGIATSEEGKGINLVKKKGYVNDVFDSHTLSNLKGRSGIAHVLYSIKISKRENLQPVFLSTLYGDIGLAHNGIITNSRNIKEQLMIEGHAFSTSTEEESFIYLLAKKLSTTHDVVTAIIKTLELIKGSYAFVLMVNGRVFGIRDPLGIKPLALGKLKDGYIVASETAALDAVNAEFIRDVRPGEIIELKEDSYVSTIFMEKVHKAYCMFEWVYFSRADSVIDGRSCYDVRIKIGENLAKESPAEGDIVVPVPDSGRSHAIGYSMGSGIPYAEGLMKNRYVGRTFIMPTKEIRDHFLKLKNNPVKSVIKDKKVILVDDSIVRGSTMKRLVKTLKDAGAKEVHVRIGCPPITNPCYLGVDMTTKNQFLAVDRSYEEIAENIGADSVSYISIDGLVDAIGIPKSDLCMGCLTGNYPVYVPIDENSKKIGKHIID